MAWLICSAIPSELETLRAFVAKAQSDESILRGRIANQRVVLAPLGIGSVEAAITLSLLLEKESYEQVWFIGTAGILAEGSYEIGQAIQVNSITLARSQGERLLENAVQPIACDFSDSQNSARVWSSSGVSETQELVRQALSCETQVENLELWGVAQACRRFEVPFGAFLGLSNFVGPQAHQQWQENKERAAAAACHLMAQVIKEKTHS